MDRKKASRDGAELLGRERRRASFEVARMSEYLFGQDALKMKDKLIRIIEANPVFSKSDKFYLSRPEAYKRVLEKSVHAVRTIIEQKLNQEEAVLFFLLLGEELPIGLHYAMFQPTIQGQGTEDQAREWLPQARMFQIIGCYAQTELGHGSNVRGLETTATYDKNTQEFIIHSPTLTSTKWWPGGLGQTATHCVTHAQLLVDGKNYGVHTFVVPIRNLEDHSPLPGITVGDIGPKMGYDTQDNGFLAFDNVRIPRENMLSKYKQVSPEGVYSAPSRGLEKMGYAPMVKIRADIVIGASEVLGKACTVAIRYSAIRRQFADEEGQEEKQVIDYQMQQYRLFPLLATAFAFHFTAKYMQNLYNNFVKGLESDDASVIPEVHATSAGLKSLTTTLASQGIEECRKCCGGHGYSKAAALSDLYVNYVPACTYEGDNIVMALQTARFLVKSLEKASKGKRLVGSVSYLQDRSLKGNCPATSEKEMREGGVLLHAYGTRARGSIIKAAKAIKAGLQRGLSTTEVTNANEIELVNAAKAHGMYTLILHFVNALEDAKNTAPQLYEVLHRLSALFGLYYMEESLGDFTEGGYLNPHQAEWLHSQVRQLLMEIRPDAISLVDAFHFSDYELNSSLGRYNGDCYEHMYHWATQSPLNQLPKPPGYDEFIKPLLSGQVVLEALQVRANL